MIGLWRMKNERGYVSHARGLNEEQVKYLQNLKIGDRLVVFENDIREGETGPALSLKRSILNAVQA